MPEIPIKAITNGVHTQTWLSDEFSSLYNRYLGSSWTDRPADHTLWKRVDKIPDAELWRSHERRRSHLVLFVRERLQRQLTRRGISGIDLAHIDEILDPDALTIGFARRFATYKRATLLMRNPERLLHLLTNRDQPIQFLFAGKSHPRDDGGKRFIQDIIKFCRREDVRPRMVFLEDYDMNVARYLVQGVDIWLNTPRRPMEASGTSGMKGPINGAVNLSILDGWWVEAYKNNPHSGWAIGSEEEFNNDDFQDQLDSESLFDLLEKEVIPEFYDRGPDGLPRRWITRMKQSIKTVCSFFNTNRMVQEYYDQFYNPANALFVKMVEGHGAGAAQLAHWKAAMATAWHKVNIRAVDAPVNEPMMAGSKMKIFATVELGGISPDDVVVELYHGPLDAGGNIQNAQHAAMTRSETIETGVHRYLGAIVANACGQQGFAVRVLPKHPNIELRLEPNLIRWG